MLFTLFSKNGTNFAIFSGDFLINIRLEYIPSTSEQNESTKLVNDIPDGTAWGIDNNPYGDQRGANLVADPNCAKC